MQITPIQNYNNTPQNPYMQGRKMNSASYGTNPNFTGGGYGKFTEWIANNYYKRFYHSKAAELIINHTSSPKWNNMTTHMSALGSTLISGMYVVKTLENDKLDPERRKTLALNDALTWGLSTLGAYWLDAKLGYRCDQATTRFAANYLLDNPVSKRQEILGKWHPKDLREMMKHWYEHIEPNSKDGKELLSKLSKEAYNGVVFQIENCGDDAEKSLGTLKPMLKEWLGNMKPESAERQELIKEFGEENFNKLTALFNKPDKELKSMTDKLNPVLNKLKPMLKKYVDGFKPAEGGELTAEGLEFIKKIGKLSYNSIRDFNLDILKDPKLTTQIDGIGVLKSLFVFGMVYRYIVPVLVMKPAIWIGNYFHKKSAEKVQNENKETVQAQKA